MAARRLVIVMIVLLAISTAVAVIAPQPAERPSEQPAQTTVAEEAEEDAGWTDPDQTPSRLHAVVDTDRDEIPKRVVALVGDRLRLEVIGGAGRTVTIPDLGLTEVQSSAAPASFELYFDEVGGYEVIELESGDRLALIVIEVGKREAKNATAAGRKTDTPEAGAAEANPRPEQPAASPQAVRA